MIDELQTTELAYLAGFIDGEGSIFIYRYEARVSRNISHVVCLSITNTHKGVLDYLAKLSGYGSVNVHRKAQGNNRQSWVWKIYSDQARQLIRAVLPYLIVKRKLGELALQLPVTNRGARVLEEVFQVREMIHSIISQINNTGIENMNEEVLSGVTTIPQGSTSEANADGRTRQFSPRRLTGPFVEI